jgi:hypothetical protein
LRRAGAGPPLRHGGENQASVIVTGIGPAGNFFKSAQAAYAQSRFHFADVDAG